MSELNFDVYDGKSFQDLCKDVVSRSDEKKNVIDILISDLRSKIKTINDAQIVVPLIATYLGIGVKNDEQLTKLLAVLQRIQTAQIDSSGGQGLGLSEEEKEQLMREIQTEDADIKKVMDDANQSVSQMVEMELSSSISK